jgi:hypothetical protein
VQVWLNPEEYRQFVAKLERAFEDQVDLENGGQEIPGLIDERTSPPMNARAGATLQDFFRTFSGLARQNVPSPSRIRYNDSCRTRLRRPLAPRGTQSAGAQPEHLRKRTSILEPVS